MTHLCRRRKRGSREADLGRGPSRAAAGVRGSIPDKEAACASAQVQWVQRMGTAGTVLVWGEKARTEVRLGEGSGSR